MQVPLHIVHSRNNVGSQLLHESKHFHTAALFMKAAVEVDALAIPTDEDAPIPLEPQRMTLDKELLPLASVRQSVFLVRAAMKWCS